MTQNTKCEFNDPKWDKYLQLWLQAKLPEKEAILLKEKLSRDSSFRESFGDWVRNLRELGWNVSKKETL